MFAFAFAFASLALKHFENCRQLISSADAVPFCVLFSKSWNWAFCRNDFLRNISHLLCSVLPLISHRNLCDNMHLYGEETLSKFSL